MKKVVVLALLLFVCVGSLFAQEDDKRKKKSITDSLFRIDQVDVMQKRRGLICWDWMCLYVSFR